MTETQRRLKKAKEDEEKDKKTKSSYSPLSDTKERLKRSEERKKTSTQTKRSAASSSSSQSSYSPLSDTKERLKRSEERSKPYTPQAASRRSAIQRKTESWMDDLTQAEPGTRSTSAIKRYNALEDAKYYSAMQNRGAQIGDDNMVRRGAAGVKDSTKRWQAGFDEAPKSTAPTAAETVERTTQNRDYWAEAGKQASAFGDQVRLLSSINNRQAAERDVENAAARQREDYQRQMKEYQQQLAELRRTRPAEYYALTMTDDEIDRSIAYFDYEGKNPVTRSVYVERTPEEEARYLRGLRQARFLGESDREREAFVKGEKDRYDKQVRAYENRRTTLDDVTGKSLQNVTDTGDWSAYFDRSPKEQAEYLNNLRRARFIGESDEERAANIQKEKEHYAEQFWNYRNGPEYKEFLIEAQIEARSNIEALERAKAIHQLERVQQTPENIAAGRDALWAQQDQLLADNGYGREEKRVAVKGMHHQTLRYRTVVTDKSPKDSRSIQEMIDKGWVLYSDFYALPEEQRNNVYAVAATDTEQAVVLAQYYLKLAEDEAYQKIYDWVNKDDGSDLGGRLKQLGRRAVGLVGGTAAKLASGLDPYGTIGQGMSKTGNALIGGGAASAARTGLFGIEALGGDESPISADIPFIGRGNAGTSYQVGASVLQSAAIAAPAMMIGRTDEAFAKVAEVLGTALMGSSAAADDYTQCIQNGMTVDQARVHATWAGINEAAFEYISLDKLVDPDLTVSALRRWLEQAGIEASEEVCTSIANRISDNLIADRYGIENSVERRTRQLMEQGLSYRAAYSKAENEWLTEVTMDGMSGFLSGLIMGGGSEVVRGVETHRENRANRNTTAPAPMVQQTGDVSDQGSVISGQETSSAGNGAVETSGTTSSALRAPSPQGEGIGRGTQDAENGALDVRRYGDAETRDAGQTRRNTAQTVNQQNEQVEQGRTDAQEMEADELDRAVEYWGGLMETAREENNQEVIDRYGGYLEGLRQVQQERANAGVSDQGPVVSGQETSRRENAGTQNAETWTTSSALRAPSTQGEGFGTETGDAGTRGTGDGLGLPEGLGRVGETAGQGSVQAENATHTPEETAVINAYRNSVDPNMVDYIHRVSQLKDQSYKAKQIYEISPVEAKQANDLQAITGIDTNGYTNAINGTTVTHIENRHGENGAADHSMANVEDIARIGYVLQNYDDVKLLTDSDGNAIRSTEWVNSDWSHALQVQYAKKIDGNYYVIEAVIDSKRKQNMVVSAYMNKNGSAAQSLNMEQNSPQLTSETPNGSGTSNNSIAQQSETVKGNDQNILQRQLAEGDDLGLAEGLGRVGTEQVNRGQAVADSQTENGVQNAGNEQGGLTYGSVQQAAENGGYSRRGAVRSGGTDAEAGQVSLSAGDRRGYGRNQTWGISQETRRQGRGREQQSVIRQRQQAAGSNELTSPAEQGVPMGAEDQTVRIWSEADWDSEARAATEFAYANGIKKVTMFVGLLQVEADGEICSVNGVVNKDTGEMFVRADSTRESVSEIIEHEVGHLKTNAAKVRAFMEEIKSKYKEAAWSKIYETYEQRYADVTGDYAGMTEGEKELYLWEEIQCDAAAFTNKFGARASVYNAEATQTLDSDITSDETVGPSFRFEGGRYSNRENSAATERTNGPGNNGISDDNTNNPYDGKDLSSDQSVYTYTFLTQQEAMNEVEMPEVSEVLDANGVIDNRRVIQSGLKNAESIGSISDGKVYVQNRYTKKDLRVDADSIRHGLNGDLRRHMTNARIGSVIGEVVQNAIPLNALHNTGKDVTGTYAMGCYVTDSLGREYVAIITVEERTNDVVGLQIEDAVHAVSGRQKKAGGRTRSPQGVYPSSTAIISIADFLSIVNSTHQSLLSNDVLTHFNASKNPNGYFTNRAKFSTEENEDTVDWNGNRDERQRHSAEDDYEDLTDGPQIVETTADGRTIYEDGTELPEGLGRVGEISQEDSRRRRERASKRIREGIEAAGRETRERGRPATDSADHAYTPAEYMADLKEESGEQINRDERPNVTRNPLTEDKISNISRIYPDKIIDNRTAWENLSMTYGEDALQKAGFTYQEAKGKEKENAGKRKQTVRDMQKAEPYGPPRPEPMTTALNSLGVKVQGSVGDYSAVKQMLANDKSAKSVQREVQRAERRLGRGVDSKVFAKEKNFAAGIAAGIYSSADVPATFDSERVMELADYYAAERATKNEMIRQRRAQIRQDLNHQMSELFKNSDEGKASSMIVLNERTPERNMRHIFGDELGEKINETIFYPTQANEAERLRFINRMHDEVRTFTDKNGKQSKLNKAERAVAQALLEGKSIEELLAAAEETNQFRQIEEIAKAIREGKVDNVKVQNAVEAYKALYNQLYEAINDFLVAHGYEPIGFIQNYAPHMQTEETQTLLQKAFQHLGINSGVTELPASIAGLTADFKPSKRWNPHFLQREGNQTKYDIAEGFEEYIEYVSDVFYHMDDTMRVREAAKYFRETYAPEEIKAEIERVKALQDASIEEKLELLRDAKEVGKDTILSESDLEEAFENYLEKLYDRVDKTTKHSNLTIWLDNYANLLAGKQSMADRGQEYSIGRRAANWSNRLVRTFAQSKVAGNLSSVFNQGAQLPMIYSELGTRWTVTAIKDITTGKLRRAAWWQQSDFLTGKHGVDYLVTTPGQMVMTSLFKPAELMDGFVSTVAVRGKYLEQIKAGKSHEEALKIADRFGQSIMGSRAKGSRPIAYSGKGIVSQMVHIFQVEAMNSWEHLSQDLPRDFREIARTKGKGKAALSLAGVIAKMLLAGFAINRLDDELYGGTPAQFDLLGLSANFIASGEGLTTNEWLRTVIDNGMEKITGKRIFNTDPDEIGDDDFNWSDALEDTVYNITNDVPFVRNISGIAGWGDQTMPMPDLYNKGKKIIDAATGHGLFSKDTGKAVLQAGTELIPGGNQINKAWQGVEAVLRGGDFSGYGSNEKLKYPLDESAISALRAIFFGKYATKESDAYYASGDSMLSVKQTQVWQNLTGSGIKRQDAYKAIQDIRDISKDDSITSFERGQQKRDLIAKLPWSDDQKAELYSGMISSSRDDEIQALAEAGLGFNDFLDVQSAYSKIDDEYEKANQKATAFARWVNQQSYSPEQKSVINENFKYWMQLPAQAGKYEDFVEAGLSDDDASDLHDAISNLQPEEGKDQVSNLQKYRAVVDAGLNEQNTMLALEKVMTEGEYLKLSVGNNYGLSPVAYVDFKEKLPEFDSDKNGSYTQDEVKSALASMKGLTDKQRAILWQITNKSWKPDNNPFNTDVGKKVYGDLNG